MSRLSTPRSLLTDPVRKYALVGALLAVPFTSAVYWRTGSEFSLGPVLLGAFVAGYLFDGAASDRSRVGALTGLLGALPLSWVVIDALPLLSSIVSDGASPAWFRAASVGLTVGVVTTIVAIGAAFAIVVGVIGARIGDWASSKAGRTRPPAAH